MLKIEKTEVMGWEHAIRGMRNPMNSWEKSDSFVCEELRGMTKEEFDAMCGQCPKTGACDIYDEEAHHVVGPNDHQLMMSLAKGGPVHAKYRRMITVYLDITAPLYWWKEFDTYKVGTVANSCSTMHKIHAKEFTLEDFSYDHLMDSAIDILQIVINSLNNAREMYLQATDTVFKKDCWWQMIQLLPTSYNQKRTVMLNYEVLHNIYHSRRHHKLDEWHVFCDWIENLPNPEIIIGEDWPAAK